MGSAGSTPLHKAAYDKDIAKVQQAIQRAPASVNAQEAEQGFTALHVAAKQGADVVIRELLRRGAKPNLEDKEGRTALHLACDKGSDAAVRDLLRGGASREARDKVGGRAGVGGRPGCRAGSLRVEAKKYARRRLPAR